MDSTRFQQFSDETGRILLTVTGVGEIAAAAAVSSVCASRLPDQDDLLVNIGICAGTPGNEGVFLMHGLVEQATGKTFYPDILYRHTFREAVLTTGMLPLHKGLEIEDGLSAFFYDMEAAAIYQAGAYFFGPHQMQFLKIVSDSGDASRVSGGSVGRLMEAYGDRIFAYLSQLQQLGQQVGQQEEFASENAAMEKLLCKLCVDMHCSKTMGDLLRQHIRYAMLAGIDYQAAVQGLYEENRLPCRDKREGKRCFEELKQRLL